MAKKIKTGYCKACCTQGKMEKGAPNHILHLILVFLTGGLWFIVWMMACFIGEYRCSACGSNRVRKIA